MGIELFLVSYASVALYFGLWYLYSLIIKRLDVIDVAWGSGFVVVGLAAAYFSDQKLYFGQYLVLAAVALWAVRLVWHIYSRNKGRHDDKRYAAITEKYRKYRAVQIFLRIFMVQATLCFLIAAPLLAIFYNDDGFSTSWLLALGIAIFATGLAIESFADLQLRQFIKTRSAKKRILQTGLWKYSRHPNYLGEIMLWWGVWCMSMAINPVWWSVLGPLVISVLLLFVSGVPMLERKYKDDPDYQKYARRTSKILLWPPKKGMK